MRGVAYPAVTLDVIGYVVYIGLLFFILYGYLCAS